MKALILSFFEHREQGRVNKYQGGTTPTTSVKNIVPSLCKAMENK